MATNKISFAVKRPRLYRPRFEAKGIRASAKKKKGFIFKVEGNSVRYIRHKICDINPWCLKVSTKKREKDVGRWSSVLWENRVEAWEWGLASCLPSEPHCVSGITTTRPRSLVKLPYGPSHATVHEAHWLSRGSVTIFFFSSEKLATLFIGVHLRGREQNQRNFILYRSAPWGSPCGVLERFQISFYQGIALDTDNGSATAPYAYHWEIK